MKILNPQTPFGHTLFCDDIRHEINGKITYVGTYRSELIVFGSLPAVLPKFVVAIWYHEQPGESDEPIEFRVFLPGDESDKPTYTSRIDPDIRQNISIDDLPPVDEGSIRFFTFTVPIVVSPLILKQEGKIKVRAYRGDSEIRLGSLIVRSQQPPPKPEQPEQSAPPN
jgi:hypothetical protein